MVIDPIQSEKDRIRAEIEKLDKRLQEEQELEILTRTKKELENRLKEQEAKKKKPNTVLSGFNRFVEGVGGLFGANR